MHNRQVKNGVCFFLFSLSSSFYIHSSALLVSISVANLALLSTNITKSTSVPSAASAFMSSQSVVLETTAGWLTSASAVKREIPAGLTSGRNSHKSLALWLIPCCFAFLEGLFHWCLVWLLHKKCLILIMFPVPEVRQKTETARFQ